jgi:hypothetical protein
LSDTPNQIAGTSKNILKIFSKGGINFPKNHSKGHFRGATCRRHTFATEYFHHIDEFSPAYLVVRQTFENAIRPFHGYSRGDVASSSIVIFQSIGKYVVTLNYMLFCPIQQEIQPEKACMRYLFPHRHIFFLQLSANRIRNIRSPIYSKATPIDCFF